MALSQFELTILDWFQANLRNPVMDGIMSFVTHFGDAGLFWIALTLVLIAIPKTRRLGCVALVSLVLDVLICNVTIKPLVARIRPYDLNPAIEVIVKKPTDYSFPSGHSAASFAAAFAYFFGGSRKIGIPAMVLAAVVAFSRLYLYIHYPTDVLAGIVIGLITALLACVIVKKLEALLLERREAKAQKDTPPEE